MKNGQPMVCNPDPQRNECVAPFHDHNDENGGGPHSAPEKRARSTAARWTAL